MTPARRAFRSAARHYWARPPYSAELRPALAARLGWDGTGRLLDAGCGPGVVALALAPSFAEVVGLDPEGAMLAEARAAADPAAGSAVRWVQGRAEEIPLLGLGTFRAVTLAQSFHWTDRDTVAGIVHEILEPGGALLLIHHEHHEPPTPGGRCRAARGSASPDTARGGGCDPGALPRPRQAAARPGPGGVRRPAGRGRRSALRNAWSCPAAVTWSAASTT